MSKQIKRINLVFTACVTVIIGLIVVSISRNIPYGTGAMLTVGVLQAIALTCILLAYLIKSKILSWVFRLLVIGWTTFAAINTMSSTNEDAWIFMSLYIFFEVTAIICGILRRLAMGTEELTHVND